ncbi:SAM-dependent methyltransferase [Actinomadura sp. 9N215]|uniref:SAM-dependent methyltransferase n=1 Tax=Actinomadura sp. 9N215 TaxID=3375150 RepID=UPI0037BA3C9A
MNDQLGGAGLSWAPYLPTVQGLEWAAAKRDLFYPLDPTTPHWSRVWNALVGGKENYPADRNFSDWAGRGYPGLVAAARHRLAFRARVVRALVGEHGIGQVLVAGTDLPVRDLPSEPLRAEVHEVAQRIDPAARVVYADADAFVMVQARAWLSSPFEDTCVDADPTDPAAALAAAAAKNLLDLAEPVGVLLTTSLDPLDGRRAVGAVERLRAALPCGSYIAVCQLTGQTSQGVAALGTLQDRPIPGLPHPRTPQDVRDLFAGVELVEPGIVPAPQWRPERSCSPQAEAIGQGPSDLWCGVGRVQARDGAR